MRHIIIMLPCLLFCACVFGTSRNAIFYTQSAAISQSISDSYNLLIGINRIRMPKYLDRPQMVTRQKDSVQLTISEYNRWAELPSVLATRVVTENLNTLLPSAQVKTNQLKGDRFDRTVTVEITDINAVSGEEAGLSAQYTIKDKTGKKITHHKFSHTVKIGKTYDDLANGYSQMLAALSQDIAGILIKE